MITVTLDAHNVLDVLQQLRARTTDLSPALIEIGEKLASTHQGALQQRYSGTKSSWPHLWGDIPARPYLGLSENDEQSILDIIRSYLASAPS